MHETFVSFSVFKKNEIRCPILVKEPKRLFWVVLYPFAFKFPKKEKELDSETSTK